MHRNHHILSYRSSIRIALLALAIAPAALAASSGTASAFSNAAIANQAERRVGQQGGHCLQFVHDMIVAAGGPRLAFGYNDATYQAQWAQHAKPVNGLKNAKRGDVIQWYHRRRGPHTAIVARPGANPELVDSNFGIRFRVRKGSFSSRNGYFSNQHKIWRVGSVNAPKPKPKGSAPIGHLDSASGQAGGAARVRGWTVDPDVPSRSTGVHVYVDGAAGSGARGVNIGLAKLTRNDVMKAYKSRWRNVGARHGFDKVITGITPGVHTLFVYAIDAGGGGGNRLISSKKVTVPAPAVTTPTPAPPAPTPPPAAPTNQMSNGKCLLASRNQTLRSGDGRYRFVMQNDGNLVLYGPSGKALWASNTARRGGVKACMQADGNLVIYTSAGKPVWASNTDRHPGAVLRVQNDGNVVIYVGSRAIWATGTNGRT